MKRFTFLFATICLFINLALGEGIVKAGEQFPPQDLRALMTPEEGHICEAFLKMNLENFEEKEKEERAKVQFVYELFIENFGELPENVNLGKGDVKNKNKKKCAMTIYNFGKSLPVMKEKTKAQWVANIVALPDILFPKAATLGPEEYQELSQAERVNRIKEVEPDNIRLIPQSMRQSDYDYAKGLNMSVTLGTFGLTGQNISPDTAEETIQKAIEGVTEKIGTLRRQIFDLGTQLSQMSDLESKKDALLKKKTLEAELGSLIVKRKNLERVSKSTDPNEAGREQGVLFQPRKRLS